MLYQKSTHYNTQQIGQSMEAKACDFLSQQGLTLIEKNYRTRVGEIDLIMREKQALVFVEVRYRQNQYYGTGSDTVTYHKQQKIIRTALHYLRYHRYSSQQAVRFDVVSIDKNDTDQQKKSRLDWIKSAFQVDCPF